MPYRIYLGIDFLDNIFFSFWYLKHLNVVHSLILIFKKFITEKPNPIFAKPWIKSILKYGKFYCILPLVCLVFHKKNFKSSKLGLFSCQVVELQGLLWKILLLIFTCFISFFKKAIHFWLADPKINHKARFENGILFFWRMIENRNSVVRT